MNDDPATEAPASAEPPTPTTEPATAPGPAPAPTPARLPHAWLVGVVAAAAGLGVTELVATVDASGPSPLVAAEAAFVDLAGSYLKNLAIALFGTNDKAALTIGAALVVLGLGALVARSAARRPAMGPVLFTFAAVVGAAAVLSRPDGRVLVAVVAPAAGAVVGVAMLTVGLRAAQSVAAQEARLRSSVQPMPTNRKTGGADSLVLARRTLGAVLLGGTALAAAAGGGAVALRRAATERLAAITRSLPTPARRATLPPAASFAGELEGRGLTPIVVPNGDFYRIDTALSVPVVNADTWSLTIDGRVDRQLTFTYDDLLAMDLVEAAVTIACVSNEVGGQLVGNAVWTGVPLLPLLERAGLRNDAEQVFATSVDGFTAGFPIGALRDGRTALLAVGMNGEPLPRDHGYPARLIIAGLYGYVSAVKWLERISLTEWEGRDGYWMPRGWDKEGPVAVASRIDVPRRRDRPSAGTVPIAGVAWAPSVGVSRVEVRVDRGDWMEATLSPSIDGPGSGDAWVQWHLAWQATPGEHLIEVRATDRNGNVQSGDLRPSGPSYATGWDRRTTIVT